ncbi:MAG: filamentous hemagglutinin N-terminal domain-containing protein [Oscillatoriophycideae cyanobacterium NC_groundwater_1537_Pr4_S-0.65um_50_18]|nr:filamentous hemagglutinin N-terminal domain-containing protein [Oscillatoriophycideae cyanobacterium NC_groundwater_1537_Pr4_S-0.65um_50_18]
MSRLIHPVGLFNSLFLLTLLCVELLLPEGVQAQVSADGTLSTTVSSADQRNFVINNGNRAGGNLFHSFREFSVPTGGSAYFNNAADVQNIFSRVTGGTVSNIDGLIRANGGANLFLLNPSGILFGLNAQLNIGGSFVGSTANSLRFSDGAIFSANSTSTTPLLTVSTPVGLQLGASPGNIQVKGAGNPDIVPTTNFGLAVAPGHTLALVGGNVTFDGGIATAAAGRLEVGSVANGEVSLAPSPVGWELGYGQVNTFRDVQLLNRSSLWVPLSTAAGSIQIHAGRVTLNNSQIAATTSGSQPGGNIFVQAANSLELMGTNSIYPFSSWIVNQVTAGASGRSGQIQINTPQLTLRSGSRIQTLNQGSGATGDIQINADSVFVGGSSPASANPAQQDLFNSRITTDTLATGNGGNIRISARQITLRNGGQVSTLVGPQATGRGGDVLVNASGAITAIGIAPLKPTTNSGFATTTVGAGAGGDLRISGDRFTMLDGGVLLSFSLGTGDGGNIIARANHTITVRRASSSLVGGLTSYTLGAGDGGNISVSTDHLGLYDGASISGASISRSADSGVISGNSGHVNINARESIEVSGVSRSPVSSSTIGTATITSGNAGDVNISTRRLLLNQGGSIGSGTLFGIGQGLYTGVGTGNGGNVRVDASDSITVRGIDSRTNLYGSLDTYTLSRGDAGDVMIQTPRLTVQDGGLVGSLNAAAGEAGRVTINANTILVSGTGTNGSPAQILSTARIPEANLRQAFNIPAVPRGDTGTLSLNAHDITVADSGLITVQHQGIGNAGQLTINADTLDIQNQGRVTAVTAAGEGGNVRLNIQDALFMRDRAQLATTAGGRGNGGNIDINTPFLIGLENSDIVAQAQAGTGGNINISANSVLGIAPRASLTAESDINASSQLGLNGSVSISNPDVKPGSGLVELPESVVDSSQQIAQTCAATQTSRFVATGRGGIPENPTQGLGSDRSWNDIRDLSSFTQAAGEAGLSATDATLLVEASQARVNAQGQVELVATAAGVPSQRAETCSATQPEADN